ncbi:MAG: chromosome segregation protein SMC, partial [Bacillus sp. (in: firmicutes)]
QQREEIKQNKEGALAKLSEASKKLEGQVQLYYQEQRKLETLKNQYEKQEKLLYQAYQYLQQSKSRKEMLEEMEEDFSGFFQGVKEVLKARNGALQGIEGAVAELITVPKQFETAMEIALGAAMQHIVVDTEQNARSAIAFLKKHSYGRATFLPLSVIKAKSLAAYQIDAIKQHPSFIGVASSLISVDAKYQEIIQNLLGNVVITKDLQGANELAKLLQYRCRLVTLDGDVVNPGGSMTGGAIKQKNNSLLSRKSELEELKVKIAEMDQKTSQLEQQVKQLKADNQAQEVELEQLRKQGEELRIHEQALKGDLREIELAEKNVNERLALYDMERNQSDQDKNALNARKTELTEKLAELNDGIQALDQQIKQLSQQKNDESTSKDALLSEINDLKIELASQKEQLTFANETLNRTSLELTENQEKLMTIQDDLQLLSSEMTNNSSGEEQLEIAAKKMFDDKTETIKFIAARRDERVKLQLELEDEELEVKELKRQHKGLVEVLKDEEVKLNRFDVELETRLSHLREEYMLTFEAAKADYPLTMSIEEARKKVKLIKKSIEELGTVNLGAIDEYERVSERYEFLLEQKTDLQNAKDTLYQVISEMDDEMKKRFEQTFTGIRSHFEPTFKALFGGGRADLRLTDPNDLLNTGVEIVAQPPGKKLQNLGLLSGGERALTAIALLFSILKVRPVPFCVLDEVEAALDEANVSRFSAYLKRYSSETQFIVITHRKGTMEEADVLYGITMQESG